jgi:hypothetical protein
MEPLRRISPVAEHLPSTEDHDRRRKQAQTLLSALIERKQSNPDAFGESIIKLHWKGGRISLVEAIDHATIK